MKISPSKDPLHGVTLALILERLVEHYGWEELSMIVPVRCFMFDPSIKSSLQFLRRTPWARTKVENLYLDFLAEQVPDVTVAEPIDPTLQD